MNLLLLNSHRPWPLPKKSWIMEQKWLDLLFAHWPVTYDQLRSLVPHELELDTYDGYAWIGVVPFRMEGIRGRGLPEIPYTNKFSELNVRTYVTVGDKPGVYFFSLDAASRLAVEAARRLFFLPYFKATMNVEQLGQQYYYSSHRTDKRGASVSFEGSYTPVSPPFVSTKGTFEHWLTERYCLYAFSGKNKIWRGDIHHLPWTLHHAEADIRLNTMALGQGIQCIDRKPVLHFSRKLDVLIWALTKV